jgi:hypothetical protein
LLYKKPADDGGFFVGADGEGSARNLATLSMFQLGVD